MNNRLSNQRELKLKGVQRPIMVAQVLGATVDVSARNEADRSTSSAGYRDLIGLSIAPTQESRPLGHSKFGKLFAPRWWGVGVSCENHFVEIF